MFSSPVNLLGSAHRWRQKCRWSKEPQWILLKIPNFLALLAWLVVQTRLAGHIDGARFYRWSQSPSKQLVKMIKCFGGCFFFMHYSLRSQCKLALLSRQMELGYVDGARFYRWSLSSSMQLVKKIKCCGRWFFFLHYSLRSQCKLASLDRQMELGFIDGACHQVCSQ